MLRHFLLLLSAACLFNSVQSDTNYRLNSPLKPTHYAIVITPYFNTGNDLAFTFDGEVSITLETNSTNVDTIRLHSQDLIFNASDIHLISDTTVIGLNPITPIHFIENYTFVDINLEAALQVGVQYVLTITYKGPIREDLNGFYRSSYTERGVTKWLAATQMEPTHARKVFPCLDEPQYKAIFSLAIDRPALYSTSLANTKWNNQLVLPNGMIRDIFEPTPVMSTYLVAFLVSEYVAAEYSINGAHEFGVYTRADAANQTAYAYDFGMRVEKALSEYLQLDYYSVDSNLKLDHVALPDFKAGAMENWGLIKYREALFLYVPEESTPYYKYRVAQILAHETTHMWFGNLVTCHWWSNTWLNEGFANYFQDYITALIEPEVGSADMLVTGSVYAAYSADESASAPAITDDNVNSPSEISAHFGTITYQKAGSVIRMIHHLIGDAAFRTGLNYYLINNQMDVGYPEKMYEALNFGVQNASSLQQYPGVTIADVMSSWISQPGHPILEVDVDYASGKVSLTQKRFYVNSINKSDEVYSIPITYTTEREMDFENTKPAFIMSNKTHEFTNSDVGNHSWIMFNIQETGFYRVNYDSHSWSHIATALKGDERAKINHLNRAKVVNDLFAFLAADEVNFETLFEVLGFLGNETDYSVWYAAITGLNSLRTRFIGSDVLEDVDSYSLSLMENVVNELGYVERSSDNFVTLRNRMQVLDFACKLEHEGCIQNTVALFRAFKQNGTKISPSLRPVAYCTGLRYGDADDFNFLWQEMINTNVANEALVIESALGCTTVVAKQHEYLNTITKEDSPIRWQDVTVPLTSILANHSNADLVLDHLQSNYSTLSTLYPSMETVVGYVAGALHTDAQFSKFETWLSGCTACSEDVKQSGVTALASARASTAWASSHRDDVLRSLRNHSVSIAPSLLLVALTCVIMGFKSF